MVTGDSHGARMNNVLSASQVSDLAWCYARCLPLFYSRNHTHSRV